jgi:hypothetical protein
VFGHGIECFDFEVQQLNGLLWLSTRCRVIMDAKRTKFLAKVQDQPDLCRTEFGCGIRSGRVVVGAKCGKQASAEGMGAGQSDSKVG